MKNNIQCFLQIVFIKTTAIRKNSFINNELRETMVIRLISSDSIFHDKYNLFVALQPKKIEISNNRINIKTVEGK